MYRAGALLLDLDSRFHDYPLQFQSAPINWDQPDPSIYLPLESILEFGPDLPDQSYIHRCQRHHLHVLLGLQRWPKVRPRNSQSGFRARNLRFSARDLVFPYRSIKRTGCKSPRYCSPEQRSRGAASLPTAIISRDDTTTHRPLCHT